MLNETPKTNKIQAGIYLIKTLNYGGSPVFPPGFSATDICINLNPMKLNLNCGDFSRIVCSLADFDNHEEVLLACDEQTGLRALIAVHNTFRGPGVGGTRLWKYENDVAAVTDVLRLSRGMTFKNAMAELPFGGGKAVILAPDFSKYQRSELMRAFGRAVSKLEGRYFTAEDVGTSCDDMSEIRKETECIFGLKETSGDPSPHTARGVFLGIEASVAERLQCDSLKGIRVLIQGVGHVGYHLCSMLHQSGAQLFVSDINRPAVEICEQEFGATAVSPDKVYDAEVDIYAPCALGATVSVETLNRLKVSIIAGAANNQLRDAKATEELQQGDILYAPDYLINAGGIINIACEMNGSYQPEKAAREVAKIKPRLQEVYRRARTEGKGTCVVVDEMARERFQMQGFSKVRGPETVMESRHPAESIAY